MSKLSSCWMRFFMDLFASFASVSGSRFCFGCALILFAMEAKRIVERLSSWLSSAGLSAHKKTAKALPPSESCNRRVILLSRQRGIFPVDVIDLRQAASVDKLLLMAFPSLSRSPLALVSFSRSDPAKSTRCSFDFN